MSADWYPMVQVKYPSPASAAAVPRDTTVAAVWHDLNRIGLRVGMLAGLVAGAAYTGLYLFTLDPGFAVSGALGLIIGLAGLYGVRHPDSDIEIVLVASGLAAIVATPIATPIGRGGLWAAIAIIATIGAFLLPERKQRRFIVLMGLLLLGQLLWPVFGYAPLLDAVANLVVSATCTVAGLTIVRSARIALDRSERIRIEMFRSVPVGLFRCSPMGYVIDANPAFAAMLGHSAPSELIERPIVEFHRDPTDWEVLVKELVDEDEPRRFAHQMVRLDGRVVWVRGFAQAIRDAHSGEIIYLEGSIEDVTQRREVEEEARRNADRFRNVFERAPIAIWEEDYSLVGQRLAELRQNGVTDIRQYLYDHPDEVVRLIEMVGFIDVNPAGIALIGASSKEEALAGLDVETMPGDVREGFVEEFIAIWEDRESLTIEIRGATIEGGSTDLALSWSVGRRPDGELDLSHVVVAIQDIEVIRQVERDLAALVESKDELVASVSHELRTPITTILGMAFELRDHADAFSQEERTDLISIIADQSRELSNIVEDLLVAAWSDGDTLSVRPEVVNVTSELSRIVSANRSGPEIDVDRPILAWADPLRLRQILRNLLNNAAKYGGPDVVITADSNESGVTIQVRDNGRGVPVIDRERVFDPYYRSQADRALPGSLGLGLPVSRRLARLMGGDLTYRYDHGSVFELTLPAPLRGHFL